MNAKILLVFGLLLVFFSCKKDKEDFDPDTPTTTTTNETDETVNDMNVPDGFNYQTQKKVAFDLTTVDSTNAVNGPIKMKIYGVDAAEKKDEIFSGSSNVDGAFLMTLDVSNHFEKIVVATDHEGSVFQHEFDVAETITGSLKYNGNLLDSDVDTRANNCYPSVNSTFSNDNKGINLSSDKKMTNVTLYYTDGTSETIQVNAKSISF